MKRIMLLCDRCPEDKPDDAVGAVRISVMGMGRGKSIRVDVCAKHRTMILGDLLLPTNGARPKHRGTAPARRQFKPGTLEDKAYKALGPLIDKHGRMDVDLITETTKLSDHAIGNALRALQAEGTVTRLVQGVYAATKAPTPPDRDIQAAEQDILKLVRHRPGIRSGYIAPLLGMPISQYKRARENLMAAKKLRLKGTKSSAQAYPV